MYVQSLGAQEGNVPPVWLVTSATCKIEIKNDRTIERRDLKFISFFL